MSSMPSVSCAEFHGRSDDLRLGVDVVAVSAIAASIETFGERFTQRIFTAHEVESAKGAHERLAARFAAKEAAIKALDLSETGVDWRNIEVRSDAAGRPSLKLNGNVAQRAKDLHIRDIAVSLSHEGDCAFAAVFALVESDERSIKAIDSKSCHTTHEYDRHEFRRGEGPGGPCPTRWSEATHLDGR
jgi:holo-[acyl-carrier protein] synthase